MSVTLYPTIPPGPCWVCGQTIREGQLWVTGKQPRHLECSDDRMGEPSPALPRAPRDS